MELFCILAVVVILYIKIHRTVHGKKNPVVLYCNVKHNIKKKRLTTNWGRTFTLQIRQRIIYIGLKKGFLKSIRKAVQKGSRQTDNSKYKMANTYSRKCK